MQPYFAVRVQSDPGVQGVGGELMRLRASAKRSMAMPPSRARTLMVVVPAGTVIVGPMRIQVQRSTLAAASITREWLSAMSHAEGGASLPAGVDAHVDGLRTRTQIA